MENSMGVGFMAVFAVSGSMVLLVHQIHKRLLSNFMEKFEFELDHNVTVKREVKKKVRFAEDVLEPSSNNKEYRKRHVKKEVQDKGAEAADPNSKATKSFRGHQYAS